ncbi:MAG: hypothetical protein WAU45_00040 [Blastocatellia bacterium]
MPSEESSFLSKDFVRKLTGMLSYVGVFESLTPRHAGYSEIRSNTVVITGWEDVQGIKAE